MSLLAIADDLTGAAEIAAIGFRAGWGGEIVMHGGAAKGDGLIVIDTDTRLVAPTDAAAVLTRVGAAAAQHDSRLIYKKTDSVLRGPVRAELTALAAALGKKRVLFVPANPSLGRVIHGGRYFVGDVPLDATAFARDPHHPAHTSDVAALFGPEGSAQVLPPGAPLPESGITIGEVSTAADVQSWARCVTNDVLPAGGGEFFDAVLRARAGRGPQASVTITPSSPTLLIIGSTAAPHRPADAVPLPADLLSARDASALEAWIARIIAAGSTRRFVAVAAPLERVSAPNLAARIPETFVELARRAVAQHAFRHLMIEGGATAAAILTALGWDRLAVVREWAQGVVTLQPAAARDFFVTMKPGSYVWPDALRTHVADVNPS